ncbi:MAG: VWA domain-containing protein [Actinomycetota bacterium]|nr:VWA domain-containing protein [Actinomycetota bacterium]
MSRVHLALPASVVAAAVAGWVPQAGAQVMRPPVSCTPIGNIQAIIDDSGSNTDTDPTGLRRNAMLSLIGAPRNADKTLGAVEFGTEATRLFAPLPIEPNASMMQDQIVSRVIDDGTPEYTAPSGGGTDYNAAFALASSENRNAQARIFLTDGAHNEGAYNLGHREAPARTFVIGLSVGAPSSPYGDPAADTPEQRLQRIADETRGRYFPAVTSSTLQETMTAIDTELNCGAPPIRFDERFSRTLELSPPRIVRTISLARSLDLTLSWTDASNRFDITRLVAYDSRGRAVAADRTAFVNKRGKLFYVRRRGRKPIPRLRIARNEGPTFESLTVTKPRLATRLVYRVQATSLTLADQVVSQASARC